MKEFKEHIASDVVMPLFDIIHHSYEVNWSSCANPTRSSLCNITIRTLDVLVFLLRRCFNFQRVPSDRQRLIFKGKVLKDGSKLSECGTS